MTHPRDMSDDELADHLRRLKERPPAAWESVIDLATAESEKWKRWAAKVQARLDAMEAQLRDITRKLP